MAAVIIPAAEGMGGNFLLFYPAIPMGVGAGIPSPISCRLAVVSEESESESSHPISRAGGVAGSYPATV